MAELGSITGKVEVDSGKAIESLSKVGKASDSATQSLNGTSSSSGDMTKSFFNAQIAVEALKMGLELVGQVASSTMQYFNSASDSANEFDRAMVTLNIIAGKFGYDGKEAQETAKGLAKELRIGVGSSANALQNLMKSGLNIEQASDLMKRFTNEAITGKSSTISLSQAVENLSFAYATGNSALGNMSGVSENFGDITEKGRDLLIAEGKSLNDITDEMAKYRGMIELTNLSAGSSDDFLGSLIDSQAVYDQKLEETSVTIGQVLNPMINEFYKGILIPMTDYISQNVVPILTTGLGGAFAYLKDLGNQLKPSLDSIWTSLGEIGGVLVENGIDTDIKDIGTELGKAFTKSIVDMVASMATNIKEFVEYLKTPEGKKATQDFKQTMRETGVAVVAVVKAFDELGLWFDKYSPKISDIITNLQKVYDLGKTIKTGGGIATGSYWSNVIGNVTGHYAEGTQSAKGGWSVVGEKGPEIVNLPKGSQVIPNNEISNKNINIVNNITTAFDIDSFNARLNFMLRTF